jgi:uncharacterized membrane protein HdeD (DUF308 family)
LQKGGLPLDAERDMTITTENVIRRNRGWYTAQGVLFIIAGLVAFFLPVLAVLTIDIILAALLLVSGAYEVYQGIVDRSGWLLLSGALSVIIGIILLVMPMAGAVALATLVAFFLFVEGCIEIMLAVQMRFSRRWGWLLAAGILSIILSIILLIGWPEQTVALVGIFLGINFLFYGIAMLVITAGMRESPAG